MEYGFLVVWLIIPRAFDTVDTIKYLLSLISNGFYIKKGERNSVHFLIIKIKWYSIDVLIV